LETNPEPRDLAGTVFGVIAIGLLMAATFWILRPFLLPLVWATMIAVATWPLLLGAQKWLRNSRALAVLVIDRRPVADPHPAAGAAVTTILQNADAMKNWIRALSAEGLPQPPAWVGNLPLNRGEGCGHVGAGRSRRAGGAFCPSVPLRQQSPGLVCQQCRRRGLIIVQLLLTLILTAILYAKGETAALGIRLFFRRLVGDQGSR